MSIVKGICFSVGVICTVIGFCALIATTKAQEYTKSYDVFPAATFISAGLLLVKFAW